MYLVFFLYALLASIFSIGKLLVDVLPPIFLISIRMIIAGTLLSLAWFVIDRKKYIKSSDYWLFGIIVFLHILLPFTCEYIALQHISPSSACLMYNLSPFLSALFSYFIFKESMTVNKWIGFLIGVSGILFYLQSSSNIDVSAPWSNLLMLISVITSSLGWIFVRLLIKQKGYSTLLINGSAMFIAGWIALPISGFYEGHVPLSTVLEPRILGLLSIMIIVANLLFYNLYGYLLTKYTATFLSFAGFITPLFAALFEWIFFGTIVSQEFFLTVCIVGCGIFIFYQEELKQGYIV